MPFTAQLKKTPSPAPNQLQFSRNFAPLSVRVNCRKERGGGLQKRGKVGTLLPARSEAGQTWRPRPRKWRSYKSNWCPRACQACLICPWVSNNSNNSLASQRENCIFLHCFILSCRVSELWTVSKKGLLDLDLGCLFNFEDKGNHYIRKYSILPCGIPYPLLLFHGLFFSIPHRQHLTSILGSGSSRRPPGCPAISRRPPAR